MNEEEKKQLNNVTQELIALQMRVVRDFPVYEKRLLEAEKQVKELKDRVEETYAKATQANRKSDIANLELSTLNKALGELKEHLTESKSQLEASSTKEKPVDGNKEPSFLSEVLALWNKRKK